ncbi:HAMP domain-containing protein [candidate division KSB1 bacterium]|nr:HAMP domain-containing protein [candidate division KSB1 bacterium]
MEIFIFWIIIIIVGFAVYSFIISRRAPKNFRLRTKLTITFFLLVLVPAIPLTFGVSVLITRGVAMFRVPGVEESLDTSLQIMKYLMEDKGKDFIQSHGDWRGLDEQDLDEQGLLYLSQFIIRDNRSLRILDVSRTDTPGPMILDDQRIQIVRENLTSAIIQSGDRSICEVYEFTADSLLRVVAFDVSDEIIRAKTQIEESLKFYKSLSLFNQSVIENHIIWAGATLFIIILAIIAIYAASVLSRGISRPIQELAQGMQRVATGDLESKVNVEAKNEFKILIDSFNKMATDLRESQQKLVKAERLAAWQDVARRVSHEIRNTLTPIQISMYRLRSLFDEAEMQLDSNPLNAIEEQVESLRKISEEFAQFARMPQVKRELNDINQLIRTITPLIEGDAKPVKIKNELALNVPDFPFDREQIKRVLLNLLKNSVDASVLNGNIHVRTALTHDDTNMVEIVVEDEGEGMPPETLEKVFDPYFTTKKRGMGLGLSIVKRIIEEHEGRISIVSEKGVGTIVTLYLPME